MKKMGMNMADLFLDSIREYESGDPKNLRDWVNSVDIVGSLEWYYMTELIVNKRVLNIDCGSYYIAGTMDIWESAIKKVDSEDGPVYYDKELSIKFLAEEPVSFKRFINEYENLANHKMPWCAVLLNWRTGKAQEFWETYHNFTLEKIIDSNLMEFEVKNVIENIELIMDKDYSQQAKIKSYIEHDSYPDCILRKINDYTLNYDKQVKPKHRLDRMGRTEDNINLVQNVETLFQKWDLEKELNSSKDTSTKKMKI
jgi:hypothetical protein